MRPGELAIGTVLGDLDGLPCLSPQDLFKPRRQFFFGGGLLIKPSRALSILLANPGV